MKPTIRRKAEEDILQEIERYTMLGLPHVARNLQSAIASALDLLCRTPEAGAPKQMPHPKLAGLRTWPIKGFDALRIYYVTETGSLDVLRMLHGKRDIERILSDEE